MTATPGSTHNPRLCDCRACWDAAVRKALVRPAVVDAVLIDALIDAQDVADRLAAAEDALAAAIADAHVLVEAVRADLVAR